MYSFRDLWGNEHIKAQLGAAITGGKLFHSYLFDAQPGMGKKTLANAFAKAVHCEGRKPGEAQACDMCVSCRTFESGNHPDTIYVTKTKTKGIGVDDIREQVQRAVELKPYRYARKIFIIDQAETMSPAAQNALLKTIEDPAPYGMFLLLSNNWNLFLPTVLSRCITIHLRPLPVGLITDYLVANGVPPEDAAFFGVYARGSIGRAKKLAGDENFRAMRQRTLAIAQEIRTMPMTRFVGLFAEFEKWKEQIGEVLDILYMWYRDVAVFRETGDMRFVIQKDYAHALQKETGDEPWQALDAVWQAGRMLGQNGNFQMTMEVMLLKLRGCAVSSGGLV